MSPRVKVIRGATATLLKLEKRRAREVYRELQEHLRESRKDFDRESYAEELVADHATWADLPERANVRSIVAKVLERAKRAEKFWPRIERG